MKAPLALILISAAAFAEVTLWKGALYTITEGETVLFRWDNTDPQVEFFEVRCVWMDPSSPQPPVFLGRTSETEIEISRPRTGHFVYEVRSGYWDVDAQMEKFSTWATSDSSEYAKVDGEPCAWRIYWKIPPPSGPIVE